MIRLRVPPGKALNVIKRIRHASCRSAAERHWQPGGRAGVTAQSICWLHCWARTGMGSTTAAQDAQEAFSQIFDKSYEWFESRVPHGVARDLRYASGDVEDRLAALTSR